MELHLFVLKERKNIFLARQISERQRGAVMAFIPDLSSLRIFGRPIHEEKHFANISHCVSATQAI